MGLFLGTEKEALIFFFMSLKGCVAYKSSYSILNHCNSFYLSEMKAVLLPVYELDNY